MGSCSSSDIIVPNDKNTLLTTNEVISLRNSWREIVHQGEDTFAVNFMLQLFKNYPNLKHFWWFLQEIETEDDLKKNPNAVSHGQKLFDAIDKVIYSLEDLNTCCNILIDLGELHFKKGITEEHFQVLFFFRKKIIFMIFVKK